ncbi:TPA: hypothetical protein P6409_004602 [Escherichia coli]|nr:hypothetical protein [Escherichia coli]HDP7077077.1 hypothetical protein [Escherichia coli]
MRQQQDEPGRFSICSRQAAVVLSVHGKKTVTVREIRANSEYTDSMVGFKTPVLNDFTGECFKRQIKDFGDELAIKIEDFETAYKTLPEEKHRFSSYY